VNPFQGFLCEDKGVDKTDPNILQDDPDVLVQVEDSVARRAARSIR